MKNNIDNIYPTKAKAEYGLIEIDGVYNIGLIITDYPDSIKFLEITEAIPKKIENRCSIYVFKQDETKILKELTNTIATANSENKTINKNQVDVDILKTISDKARELRRKIQIENEGVFRVCIYISVWDKVKQKALEKARIIQSLLYSKGIVSKTGNFRQKELYISSLPLATLDEYLKNITYRTFTTTGISYIFPYYNKYILEKEGVQFGIVDKYLCIVDMFSKKSTNANMLILGSSGSGKSYFAHLLVIRGAINNILQRIIDPEGEYIYLANVLGGQAVDEEINLMYFSEDYLKNNKSNYIDKKTDKTIEIINSNNIFTNVEKEEIKIAMIKAYSCKGINREEESLYMKKNENGVFINKEYIEYLSFPNLEDVLDKIAVENIKNSITIKLKQNILEKTIKSRKIINKKNIIVYNLKDIPDSKREIYLQIYLENIKEESLNGDKLQIYIDELWRCIGYGKNEKVIYEVTNIFKSIRKKNAGIIAITQDISDLFKYENGSFAKSILNNSYIKAYFKMEYTDIETLERLGISDKKELDRIKKLNKGSAILTRGWTTFCLDVIANDQEKEYIEGDDKIETNFSSNRQY